MQDRREDAARVRFFPPGIPLLTIVLGSALDWVWPIRFGPEIGPLVRYVLGGLVIVGAVLGLGARSVLLFRSKGQSANPWKPTPVLETGGPYAISRNRMYLQMIIVCLGAALLTASWWTALLTPIAAYALRRLAIEPEEAYLERKFGERYVEYKRRVRRWL